MAHWAHAASQLEAFFASLLPAIAAEALSRFRGVKRRLELLGTAAGVDVYDDFAHHPTAIATTLQGLRKKVGGEKILAIIEPRSNTMRSGEHARALPAALSAADAVFVAVVMGAP